MRKTLILLIAGLMFGLFSAGEEPDFGKDGLKRLSNVQIEDLAGGEIVFSTRSKNEQEGISLIEAAIVFNQTTAGTWKFLERVEDQIKYIKEMKELKTIKQAENKKHLEFLIKIVFWKFRYRVIHLFYPDKLYIKWSLDKNFSNDLLYLKGYWKLYPYPGGRTLARYGSSISLKSIPAFIESMFKKTGVNNDEEKR